MTITSRPFSLRFFSVGVWNRFRISDFGFRIFFSVLSVSLWFNSGLAADTFYPMVMSVTPVAVQAGQTTECVFEGRYNFYGAYQVFITGDGVSGEVDAPKPGKGQKPYVGHIKVRFKAAADALLGVRDVRLATPQGASTLGQIVVVRDPIVREAPNNDTMKTAQAIRLPAAVCGAIEKPEDVDYFKFKVKAGTALTFHVHCHRLENKIHDLQEVADPILTLRNAAGTVLAVNDNYFAADPLLLFRFAQAGEYFLEIRDVRYAGNPYWKYCIEINDRPFITNVFPSRVSPGIPTKLDLVGFNLPKEPVASLTLPKDTPEGLRWAMLALPGNQVTNAVPIIVSLLPEVVETPGDHSTPAKAQTVVVPAGISGCIRKPGEVDCYAFEAKAGEQFTFTVRASVHQSKLDSILRILDAKGQPLMENDDSNDGRLSADSRIESWTAPANGRYTVEIRDAHLRGGPEFVYFLKMTRSAPYFTLKLDTDKTLLAPGIASVIYARVTRKEGFTGDVQLSIDGLPPGVTATCGRILATGLDGCIILRAAANAPRGAANVRVIGTASYQGKDGRVIKLTASARPLQEFYSPGGGRGHYPVILHTVSVGDPVDLVSVKLSTTAVTLKPGESKKIDITIERAKGFNQPVTLAAFYQHLGQIFGNSLPPGVTVDEKASQTLLGGTQSKGSIVLKAAADAKPVQNQVVALMAHVSINFVMKFTYSGEPVLVTVTK
jgi:hypothetical protein